MEWDPPLEEDRNGVLMITGYRLVLEWEVGQEYRVNTTHTSYNFTQLQQGTTYYCAVAAYTAIGTGPYYRTSLSTPVAPTPTPSITTPASSSLPPFTSAVLPCTLIAYSYAYKHYKQQWYNYILMTIIHITSASFR